MVSSEGRPKFPTTDLVGHGVKRIRRLLLILDETQLVDGNGPAASGAVGGMACTTVASRDLLRAVGHVGGGPGYRVGGVAGGAGGRACNDSVGKEIVVKVPGSW